MKIIYIEEQKNEERKSERILEIYRKVEKDWKGISMEIRNIVTFLKVAGTQNFSKAAEQLGYSQSAITVQIQQLERELNVQLFERIGKRVYLTEKGQEFVPYANEIMNVVEQAMEFPGEQNAVKGKLRIGGVESVCTALLPDLILRMHQLYPDIEVVIRSGTTNELVEMAKTNELDLVFTFDKKMYNPEWVCIAEKTEEVCFVTGNHQKNQEILVQEIPAEERRPDNSWKQEGPSEQEYIGIEQLVEEPFILTEMGAAYQYELEQLLAERELRIDPILEIGNTETIIQLVKKGMGVSFLPKFTVEKELKKGKIKQIQTDLPEVRMHCQLLYHKNKHLTPQMKVLIGLVQESFEKMEQSAV